MILLATLFVIAQALDLATYLMAPYLERNLVPTLLDPVGTFAMKVVAVILILAGAAWLARRGREKTPVLLWAKAVLVVGAVVGFASFGFNAASLGF